MNFNIVPPSLWRTCEKRPPDLRTARQTPAAPRSGRPRAAPPTVKPHAEWSASLPVQGRHPRPIHDRPVPCPADGQHFYRTVRWVLSALTPPLNAPPPQPPFPGDADAHPIINPHFCQGGERWRIPERDLPSDSGNGAIHNLSSRFPSHGGACSTGLFHAMWSDIPPQFSTAAG